MTHDESFRFSANTVFQAMTTGKLTKIRIDLPNHLATGGESIWAEELGSDLYRVRNIPFYAYGLNFYDVVRATSDNSDLKPEVRELVQAGGHRTLRLRFVASLEKNDQVKLLETLGEFKVYHERATATFVAIDVEPDGSYEDVCSRLLEWENAGLLSYETCETRVEGSFDDDPKDN